MTSPGGAARVKAPHLLVVEVGLAGVKQPAVSVLHRHARMPKGVAAQRHKQDLGRQTFQVAHGVEAKPWLEPGRRPGGFGAKTRHSISKMF